MEINKILSADVLDIIFEGKNKQYGAYELRKSYAKRFTIALLITGAIALLLFLSSFIGKMMNKNDKPLVFKTEEVALAEVNKNEPPPTPPPPPPPPPPTPPPPKVETVKFTPPKIVEDEKVTEKIQEIQEEVKIDVKTQEGVKEEVVQKQEEVKTEVVAEKVVEKKEEDENQVFLKAEFPAEPTSDWNKILERNLDPEVPVNNGAPGGKKYTVVVKFIVMKDGSIDQVSCENDPGFGMCNEAVRVVKKAPRWKPGRQNGHDVNSWHRQPISFIVPEE